MATWVSTIFECDELVELCAAAATEGVSAVLDVLAYYVERKHLDQDPAAVLCDGLGAALIVGRAFGLPVGGLPSEMEKAILRGELFFSPGDTYSAAQVVDEAADYVRQAEGWDDAQRTCWAERVEKIQDWFRSVLEQGTVIPGGILGEAAPVRSVDPLVREGNVITIPVGEDASVVAKVLFASRKWRGLIVLGVSDEVVPRRAAPSCGPVIVRHVLNTVDWALRWDLWAIGDFDPLSEQEVRAQTWIDGGHVWVGDERPRKADPSDFEQLPKRRLIDDIHAELLVRLRVDRNARNDAQTLASCYHLRGRHFLKNGLLEQAVRQFDRALETYKRMPAVCMDRAEAWERLGQPQLAERDRARARALRGSK